MNFQLLPTGGLLPQGAVPVYGAPTGSGSLLGSVVGARGILGPTPGQLPLLATQGGGLTVASSVSQAALLSGMRPTLGSQAMLTAGARLLVPSSSQSVVGGMPQMLVMPGGVVPSVDTGMVAPQAGDKSSAEMASQLDGKFYSCFLLIMVHMVVLYALSLILLQQAMTALTVHLR
jgi:hypothetical protein